MGQALPREPGRGYGVAEVGSKALHTGFAVKNCKKERQTAANPSEKDVVTCGVVLVTTPTPGSRQQQQQRTSNGSKKQKQQTLTVSPFVETNGTTPLVPT